MGSGEIMIHVVMDPTMRNCGSLQYVVKSLDFRTTKLSQIKQNVYEEDKIKLSLRFVITEP